FQSWFSPDCKMVCFCFFLFSLFPGEPIIAAPGDDVILPCRLDSQEDLQDHIVEWTKLDMKPDPQGHVPFVYLYWSRTIMTKVMIPSFIPRVSVNQDGLKRGDVTLKIRNVSLQDEGKYSCFIPGKNFRETVQLVVGEFALKYIKTFSTDRRFLDSPWKRSEKKRERYTSVSWSLGF
uniref:Ig-like domain-containing protein n=1 Tax=Oryzias sinensis TaxID=183150 RepID=A0A8C7WW43_9TELE